MFVGGDVGRKKSTALFTIPANFIPLRGVSSSSVIIRNATYGWHKVPPGELPRSKAAFIRFQ